VSYLIDTHVLRWFAMDPGQLGKTTRRILEREPTIYFSSLSIAELRIKEQLGRISVAPTFLQELAGQGLTPLAFEAHHAWELGRFSVLAKHDPFDRMILAQAASVRLNLITADAVILNLGLGWVQDARG